MKNELVNICFFDLVKSDDWENILSLLVNDSVSRLAPSDLYWIDISESLLAWSCYSVCSLGFIRLGLDTPENSQLSVVERHLRVANGIDIGISMINDLADIIATDDTKSDAVIISCPSLGAIFLLSRSLRRYLMMLSGGRLIITVNVNVAKPEVEVALMDGSLCFSDNLVRAALHQVGFKRIVKDIYNNVNESWASERNLVEFKDKFADTHTGSEKPPSSSYTTTYFCDLGIGNGH